MFSFLAVYRAFEIPPGALLGLVRHSSHSSFSVAQEPSRCRRYPNLSMVAKTRKRRGKKPGPKPLPRELKRRRITITLTPKYHKQVAAHKSPGMFVEHCISLAWRIAQEQCSQLVAIYLATGETVDKLIHEAVQGYLDG